MLPGIQRLKAAGVSPFAIDHQYPSDDEVLHALATIGALVALADGLVADAEREALVDFSTKQRLISKASASTLGRVFDDRVEQLQGPACAQIILKSLRPLVGRSAGSAAVRTAAKVAAADGIVHPGELRALDVIRRVIKAN